MKKLLSFVMALLLSMTVLPQATINVSAQTEETPVVSGYEIYPTPQVMSYDKGSFIVDTEVNVVVEEGIDVFTTDRLEETLALKGIKATYSTKIDKNKTNILLGIFKSEGTVDSYFNENYNYTHEDLFDHIDSSFLKVDNNVITIVGKDTDSVFYAITSLYHVFTQMDTNTIENFTIEDYADVLSRGFIEGYYGEPWSTEDRVDLMEFGGYYKLNSYFYAPKDDPKHNSQWRILYTEEELVEMEKLAVAGNKSKTRFVYALHPYMYNAIRHNNEEHYQEDLGIIKAKFTQMLDVGVRQFSVLADDAGVPNGKAENYTRLMVDLTKWLTDMQKEYEGLKTVIPFVPNDYMGDGSSGQLQTIKEMPENIQIVMTGGRVWGEVSQEFTNKFTKNMDRGPYMWINWPCTDNSKKHLIMGGGHVFLQPNVNPDSIEGIVLNPMQQSEPSKLAIFINAAYTWNIWDSLETADQAWEDAFSFIDHNTAIDTPGSLAYKELSKHMINQDMDGRVTALQESIDLKPILNDFKAKFNNKTVTKEDIETVRAEFEILANAAKVYRTSTGNKRTLEQITPWINSWDDTTSAAINLLNAVEASIEGNDIALLDYFSAGQTAFANSKKHGFSYIDHIQYAEVGVQHIVPFIKLLEKNLLEAVEEASGLGSKDAKFISNLSREPEEGGGQNSSFKHMFDGNPNTAAYWPDFVIHDGTFFGLDFGKDGKEIKDFEFLLGISGYLHDTVYKGRVEYTVNGEDWITISTFDEQLSEFSHEFDEPTHLRAIRVMSESTPNNKWFGIRELSYNKNDKKPEKPTEDFTYKFIQRENQGWSFYQGNAGNLFDGSEDTFVWFQTKKDEPNKDSALVDDWVGMDLGRDVVLDKIHLTMGYDTGDKLNKYDVEISLDGKEWDKVESLTSSGAGKTKHEMSLGGTTARYVRVVNKEYVNKWIKITNFTVSEMRYDSTDNVYTNVDNPQIFSNFDTGYVELKAGSATLKPNDYYGVDLGKIEKVDNLIKDYTGVGLTLEYSVNTLEWTELKEDTKVPNDFKARYIRFINKTDEAIEFANKHIKVEYFMVTPPSYHSGTIAKTNAGGDMRNNGDIKNLFDNNPISAATFRVEQRKGTHVIFDLGQVRDINSIEYHVSETQKDFIRGAIFETALTADSDEWTRLFDINLDIPEGIVTDNKVAKDYEGEGDNHFKHGIMSPGYMSKGANDLNVTGRYIKVTFTRDFNRWTQFAELRINEGEYVSQDYYAGIESNSIEKEGQIPSFMFDGNIGTSYTPAGKTGSFTYTISNPKEVNRLRLLQAGTTAGVTLSADFYDKDLNVTTEKIGSMDQTITEFNVPEGKMIKNFTVTWTEGAPSFSEIVTFDDRVKVDKTKLVAAIAKAVDTKDWTTSTAQAYDAALKNAESINANAFMTQIMVDSALSSLEGSIAKGQVRYSGEGLQTLIDEKISNTDRIYTGVSYNKYADKIIAVEAMIANIKDTSQVDADKLIAETQAAIAELVYSTYQRELAELRYNAELRNAYTAEMFTEVSYEAYATALDAINEAIIESKEDVNARDPKEFMELVEALDAVTLVNVQALKLAQKEFDTVLKEFYEENLYKAYEKAIQDSLDLLVDGTQEAVDAAVETIKTAYENLKLIVDVKLDAVIKEIEKIDGNDYSKATYDALIKRKDAILDDKDASDDEKISYYKELVILRAELVAVNALNNRIAAADVIIEGNVVYTKSSYDAFTKAYNDAKVAADKATTEAEVSEAVENLNKAIVNLTEGITKDQYAALIKSIDAIDTTLYTKSSVEVFNKQTSAIKAANFEEVTKAQYVEFVDAVEAAIDQLVVKVSKADYDKFMESIESVDASKYTVATYEEYAKALEALKNIDLDETSKAEYEALVNAYNKAIEGLEVKDTQIPQPGNPDKPGIDKPGIDKPGIDKPGTDKPGTDKPGTDKPGTDKPGADADKLPTTGMPTNYSAIIVGLGSIIVGLYFALKTRREESN